jgi:hypothetical protein
MYSFRLVDEHGNIAPVSDGCDEPIGHCVCCAIYCDYYIDQQHHRHYRCMDLALRAMYEGEIAQYKRSIAKTTCPLALDGFRRGLAELSEDIKKLLHFAPLAYCIFQNP